MIKQMTIRSNIHIVRIESAVEHGCLSAFTDAGCYPFAWINGLEGFADGVKVVSAAFGCQVLPITGCWRGFQEITVFHENHVGVKESGEFFPIFRR